MEMPRFSDYNVNKNQPEETLPSINNPFDAAQYKDIQLPEAPISYGGSMADAILNDNEVPEKIRKAFWFIFHKDNTLTFLDEERKQNKLLNMDIIRIDILNSTPYYEYDFDMETNLNILRNIYETKLDRALGIKGHNERLALISQFSETKQISEMSTGQNSKIKQGFISRLFGRN